ncbi:MAG: alpha/beta hydrolase [Gammaproteobacteria bacterium]|nr:alpha/beta hydrolase [Gammaproteobacteria bacterium]
MLQLLAALFLSIAPSLPAWATETAEMMTSADLANFDHPPPDVRIHYGNDPLQFGDLRLPEGDGPHPVAVFIHGGCWLAEFDIAHSEKLTAALTRNGIATWSLEYRRVGNPGGGWPGTFLDIGNGADHLRLIADEHNLDLERVITMGHSAGGHLAIWAAARGAIPANSEIAALNPIPVNGVLALAPAAELQSLHEAEHCGHVVDELMGGSPDEQPDHYRWGNPAEISPGDLPQVLIIGKHDTVWAPAGLRYYDAAKARGDTVEMIEAAESGHFEMIDPDSTTWPLVLESARVLLGSERR